MEWHLVAKTDRASSEERKEVVTREMSQETNREACEGTRIWPWVRHRLVMLTSHGNTPSEKTSDDGPVTFLCVFWMLEHEIQQTHSITSSRNTF